MNLFNQTNGVFWDLLSLGENLQGFRRKMSFPISDKRDDRGWQAPPLRIIKGLPEIKNRRQKYFLAWK